MPRKTTARRRSVGSIRVTKAGTYQVRLTGPDGKMRAHGTHRTKIEAERVLARLVAQAGSTMWIDVDAGTEPVGAFIRHWLTTRTDIRDSTRQLDLRLCDQWIDRPIAGSQAQFGAVDLSATPLRALTPALTREWMHLVVAESRARAIAHHRAHVEAPSAINAQIRAWARRRGISLAATE
ncbi:hypothetical protein ACNHYB_09810 [Isoptericola jiangsuensis]|uniref:hypothetical protein n=1 Tax=Isoptericola jiangsuensis TaxID=548579 RepID=UPI003AB05016